MLTYNSKKLIRKEWLKKQKLLVKEFSSINISAMFFIWSLLFFRFFFSLAAAWLFIFSWCSKACLESKRKTYNPFITSLLSVIASIYDSCHFIFIYLFFPSKVSVRILGQWDFKKSFSSETWNLIAFPNGFLQENSQGID